MVLGVWVELFEITVVVEIFSPALPDTSGECFQFLPFVFFHKKDIERTLPNELPKQFGTFELGVMIMINLLLTIIIKRLLLKIKYEHAKLQNNMFKV
jgi:hypothetical protein